MSELINWGGGGVERKKEKKPISPARHTDFGTWPGTAEGCQQQGVSKAAFALPLTRAAGSLLQGWEDAQLLQDCLNSIINSTKAPLKKTPWSPTTKRFIPPDLQPNKNTQERQISQGLITEKSVGRGILDLILKQWQVHCSRKGQGLPKGVISCLHHGYQYIYLPPSAAEMAPLMGFTTALLFKFWRFLKFVNNTNHRIEIKMFECFHPWDIHHWGKGSFLQTATNITNFGNSGPITLNPRKYKSKCQQLKISDILGLGEKDKYSYQSLSWKGRAQRKLTSGQQPQVAKSPAALMLGILSVIKNSSRIGLSFCQRS